LSKSDGEYILEAEDVVKRFGGLVAVNHVNLKVRRESVTMLMGPNGAGKTTFVNVCTGVLKPDGGRIYFMGEDITGLPSHKIYAKGFVRTFQVPQPFSSLTVLENVLVAMKTKGEGPIRGALKGFWVKEEEENVEKALRILAKVGLDEYWDREAYTLGGAQLKMLEVARGLAAGAKLIALDEPIGGVDPVYADEILSYVRSLKKDGLSFLLIEHRIDIALPYADYVYVMDRGKVISEGTPDQVANDRKVIEVYVGE